MKKQIYFHLFMLFFVCLQILNVQYAGAQTKTKQKSIEINNYIKDAQGKPIAGAIIYAEEGSHQAISNHEGYFSIEISENSKILIEADGYNALTIPVFTDQTITMEKASLNVTVKMPFKSVEKQKVVGNVSLVDADRVLKYDQVNTISGLQKWTASGLLSDGNIHGLGGALMIVDGVPREEGFMNPDEIDQITVLKDLNSVILYGPQARNGVILITTKRGSKFKKQVKVKIESGFSVPVTLPQYLNSPDYLTLYNEALRNDGKSMVLTPEDIAKYDGSSPYRFPNVDYYGKDFLKSAVNRKRAVAQFSGGNNTTSYYANFGWQNDGTILKKSVEGTGNNRFNGRGNIDFKVTENIKGYVDASMVVNMNIASNGNNFFSDVAAKNRPSDYSPLLDLNMIKDPSIQVLSAQRIDGHYVLGGRSPSYTNNVIGSQLFTGHKNSINQTIMLNTGFEIDMKDITPGLKLKTGINLDMYSAYVKTVGRGFAWFDPGASNDATAWGVNDTILKVTKYGNDTPNSSESISGQNFYRQFAANASLNYNRQFGDHHFAGLLLGYFSSFKQEGSYFGKKNLHGGLQLAYDYQKCLLIDFSSALSYSNLLPDDNRIGFSPTLGLGWVISNSDFWNKNSSISFLKLKGSAGILQTDVYMGGASEVDSYSMYKEVLKHGSEYSFGNGSGYTVIATDLIHSLNPALDYEKMRNLNVGFEASLFDNALTLDANYFNWSSYDKIVKRQSFYPGYLGTDIPYENYEESSYSGIDVALDYTKNSGDFTFTIGVKTLYSTSNVGKNDEAYDNAYQTRIGKPTDARFGLEFMNFFADQAEIDNAPVQKFSKVVPGDMRYVDQNGDNKIDSQDAVMIGHSNARLINQLHLIIEYKNISLFMLGTASLGATNLKSSNYYWIDGNEKYTEEVLGRWVYDPANNLDTRLSATYPRLSSGTNTNNFQNSDFWQRNGDYFTLNTVQLSYNLPRLINGCNLYLRGTNLLRISEDSRKSQIAVGAEPNYRYMALGVKLDF